MLHRSLSVLIVLFWLAMTGMLLRKELGPRDSALRVVPIAHVMRLILQHEQVSDLHLYNERQRIGQLRLQPHAATAETPAKLEFSGNLALSLPGAPRQRVAWQGSLELGRDLELQRLSSALTFHDPSSYNVEVDVDPVKMRVKYELRAGAQLVDRAEYSLDQKGLQLWLDQQGIDTSLVKTLYPSQRQPPHIKALQSTMQIHGENIGTYLVSIEQGGQTLLEFHVSQLGQILKSRSFVGYSAAPEDLVP